MKYLITKIFIILIFLYFIKTSKYLIENDINESFNNLLNNQTNSVNLNNNNSNLKKTNTEYKEVKTNSMLLDENNLNKDNSKDRVLFQDYGPTNYIDPRNMTDIQKETHKNYFPKNMTLQDYVNWLLLNRDNINNLRSSK